MKDKNYSNKKIILIILYIVIINKIFALSGVKIIENAEQYLTWQWYCNDWNVRTTNADVEYENNDWRYPFFPKGERIKKNPDNTYVISDGWHTGIAYAWGLRETGEVNREKLEKEEKKYLAGLLDEANDPEGIKKTPWFKYYTGLDCSGFVANVVGLPYISNGSTNPLWIWHPSASHLMSELFSEEITWDKLVKGDILVKSSHVALVIKKPENNTVDVIESAIRWDSGYVSKVCANKYTRESSGKIVRNHEPGIITTTYNSRRLMPPYVKRVAIYEEEIEGGEIEGYNKIYEKGWDEKGDGSGLEIKDIITPKAVQADKIYIEVEFTKAMRIKTGYGSAWEEIEVKIGKSGSSALKFTPVHSSDEKLITVCNRGKKIEEGWGDKTEIDNGAVYRKWIGVIERKYLLNGENTIYVDAKSLMQDRLDSNPVTIAKRNNTGGWDDYEAGEDTNHKFTVVPKGSVLYASHCRPATTATPYYDKVIIKDLKQEPTEEMEAAGTVTPEVSVVPTSTPIPTITEVHIKDYLKNVLYGLVGEANFSDVKYKNGFKALGIAAYTLLLYEMQQNRGVDIIVNGYEGSQNYYIPYKSTNWSGMLSGTKKNINDAIEEITVQVGEGENARYYIKAFWFEAIKQNREDFERMVNIGGQNVKWPYIKTLIFSYGQRDENKNGSIEETERRNVIIQSGLNVIGKAETYLRETLCDEVEVAIPTGLKSGTKCGMSAWGALKMSENFNEELILKRFYHWAPVILNKVVIKKDEVEKYYMEWGKVTYENGKIMRYPGVKTAGQLSTKDTAEIKLYFTDKINAPINIPPKAEVVLKRADDKGKTAVVPVILEEGEDGHLSVLKGAIGSLQYNMLLSGEEKTKQVIIAVNVTDKYTNKSNDHIPESVPVEASKGNEGDAEKTGYEFSVLGSDETNVFSLIYETIADESKQGDEYANVDKEKTDTGSDVKLSLDGKLSVDMNIQLPKQSITITIPRVDLDGAKWGFDGSKFAIALFPDIGQYLSGWKFSAEMLQGSISNPFRGIKGPQIVVPPIDTGIDLSGIISQITGGRDTLCGVMDNMFDAIEGVVKYENGVEKPAYGGNIKVCGSGVGANALLDYITNTTNAQKISKIGAISLTGMQLGGIDVDAINVIMQAQDIANKTSIALALIAAINMIPNPGFAAYLTSGALGYARSWGESAVKALTYQALSDLIKNNQGAVEELVKKLPGGDKFPGFGGSIDKNHIYKTIFGCEPVTDFEKFWENFWDNIDWWALAGDVANYTSQFESNSDLNEGSQWLTQLQNRNQELKDLLTNVEKIYISGVAGKSGANMTIKSAALSLISQVLSILKTIPEPITNSIANIGPIVISVLNSTDGDLWGTLDSQLGVGTTIRGKLEETGKTVISQLDLSNMPKVDLGFLNSLPIKFDAIPFMGDVFNQVLSSLSYGKGPQADPARILAEMDEPGEIGIFYPYKPDDPLVPFPNYNGWLAGVTTDNAIIHVEGWASDYLPQFLQIYAQADNGPIVTTVLKLDTTLMTTADGKRGKADWALDVPLPHAGKNVVKVWSMNAGGHRVETSFIAYLVGTSFPQQGSRCVPTSSFIWRIYSGGLFSSVVAEGGGIINFLNANPGEEPLSEVFTVADAAGKEVKVFYPDETLNPDLILTDENGVEVNSVPSSGKFRFKLKGKYTGKSFIGIVGAADALEFKEYNLEYKPTTVTAEAWTGIISSNIPKMGPLFQYICAWDVWSRRLTGQYTLRTLMTDENLNYSREEKDRCDFTIGTPVDLENTAPTIVSDPYFKFQLTVPPGLVKQTEYVNVYSENTQPDPPLMSDLYDSVTSKYGIYPDLDSSKLNVQGSNLMMLTIKYTEKDLELNGKIADIFGIDGSDNAQMEKARRIIEENLGIYREITSAECQVPGAECNTKILRQLITGTQHPIGTYTVMTRVAEATGKYYVLAADKPPILRYPPFASPFIFNPEEEAKGKTCTAIYFAPMAATSKYVYADVKIMTNESDPAKRTVVRHLYNGIERKEPIELRYAGIYGDVDEYRGSKYWFYNFVTDTADTYRYRNILNAPLDGFTWDGMGNTNGSYGYVGDGVYRAVITIMDVFGNTASNFCYVVKGRIVPEINQIAGKYAKDGMSLDVDADGNTVVVSGLATGGEAYRGYMLGYRSSDFVVSDPVGNPDEGYNYIELPKEYTGGAVTTTVYNLQINRDKLGVWDISALNSGKYDLTLFILGEVEEQLPDGETQTIIKVVDRATIKEINITNPPGIHNAKAEPNPFSTGTTITANVNVYGNDIEFIIKDLNDNVIQTLMPENPAGIKYIAYLNGAGLPDGYYKVQVVAGEYNKEFMIRKVSGNSHIVANITEPTEYLFSDFSIKGNAYINDSSGHEIPVKLDYYEIYMSVDAGEWKLIRKSALEVRDNGIFVDMKIMELNGNKVNFKLIVFDNAGNKKEVSRYNINIIFVTSVSANPNVFIKGQNDKIYLNYSMNKDCQKVYITISKIREENYVRNISNLPNIAGKYSYIWDGKDDNGNEVTEGIYSANFYFIQNNMTGRNDTAFIYVFNSMSINESQGTTLNVYGKPYAYFDFGASGYGEYDRPIPVTYTVTGYATENWNDFQYKTNKQINVTDGNNGNDTNGGKELDDYIYNIPFNQQIRWEADTAGCGSGDPNYHDWYILVKDKNDIEIFKTGGNNDSSGNIDVPRYSTIRLHVWADKTGLCFQPVNTSLLVEYRALVPTIYFSKATETIEKKNILFFHRESIEPFALNIGAKHNIDWDYEPQHGKIINYLCNKDLQDNSTNYLSADYTNAKKPEIKYSLNFLKGTITGWGGNIYKDGKYYSQTDQVCSNCTKTG